VKRDHLKVRGVTVEPRFNEVAGDRPNLFAKSRVRYIEVIVKDWFVTGDFYHAIQCNFRHPEVLRFEMQIHSALWLSLSIIFTFEQTRSFCLQKNDTFRVAI